MLDDALNILIDMFVVGDFHYGKMNSHLAQWSARQGGESLRVSSPSLLLAE